MEHLQIVVLYCVHDDSRTSSGRKQNWGCKLYHLDDKSNPAPQICLYLWRSNQSPVINDQRSAAMLATAQLPPSKPGRCRLSAAHSLTPHPHHGRVTSLAGSPVTNTTPFPPRR